MAWTATKPHTRTDLITRVVRPFGLTSDAELKTVAGDLLDETVIEMNTHLYEFNKKKTILTLTADTNTYLLPSAFYRESIAYLRDITIARDQAPMVYLPNVKLHATPNIGSGIPYVYTLRNVHDDGLVELAPTPNADAVAKYSFVIEYYTRIALPSNEDPINVPQEVEVPLVYGAQKRMAMHLHGPGHADVGAYDALEQRALYRLKGVDKRHPDQQLRFTLLGHSTHAALGTPGGGGGGGGAVAAQPRTGTSLPASGDYIGELFLLRTGTGEPTIIYIWAKASDDEDGDWNEIGQTG